MIELVVSYLPKFIVISCIALYLLFLILVVYGIITKKFNILNDLKDWNLILILLIGLITRLVVTPISDYVPEGHAYQMQEAFLEHDLKNIENNSFFNESPFVLINFALLGIIFNYHKATSVFVLFHSLLSIIIIYLIAKKSFNKQSGQLAALFISLNPVHIFYSTDIYLIFLPYFYMLTFIFILLKSMKEKSNFLFKLSLILLNLVIFLRIEYIFISFLILVTFVLIYKRYIFFKKNIFLILLNITSMLLFLLSGINKETLTFDFGFFQINLLSFNYIQPFNSIFLLLPLIIILVLEKIKISKEKITLAIIIIFFLPILFFFWDFSPRAFLIPLSIIIIFVSEIVNIGLTSKNKISNIVSCFFILSFVILTCIHLIELNKRYYANESDFKKKVFDNKERFFYGNCDLKELGINNSLIIIKEKNPCINPSYLNNSISDLNEFLISKQINNVTDITNMYLIYDINFYRMSTNSVFFRTNKILNYLDLERVGKTKYSKETTLIYKVKGKRKISDILFRNMILPINYLDPK